MDQLQEPRIDRRKVNKHAMKIAFEISSSVHLTPQELEVAKLLAVGHTMHEIAAELGISVKTTDTHRGHVLTKTSCRNNAELARWALRQGLVEL